MSNKINDGHLTTVGLNIEVGSTERSNLLLFIICTCMYKFVDNL